MGPRSGGLLRTKIFLYRVCVERLYNVFDANINFLEDSLPLLGWCAQLRRRLGGGYGLVPFAEVGENYTVKPVPVHYIQPDTVDEWKRSIRQNGRTSTVKIDVGRICGCEWTGSNVCWC